ncbi:MAG TPA: carboxypeptidase regulatory-like domain-containing protein [Pyrinomonadaceae bacterium]|nr:carboxypeptidase regulatory-like domain-containing protein [Pyrinomonadaceae bacterium]
MKNKKPRRASANTKGIFGKRYIYAISLLLLGGLIVGLGAKIFSANSFNAKAQSLKDANSDEKTLSPQVLQQIAALDREKESRTPAQRKVDSRLLYQAKMERKQEIADGVPTLDTGIKVDYYGFVDVDISANVNEKLLSVLRGMSAEIIFSAPQYKSITARMPLAEVENLAARSDVYFIMPKQEAMTSNAENPQPIKRPSRNIFSSVSETSAADVLKTNPAASFQQRAENVRNFLKSKLSADDQLTGTVTSQADTTHRAALARTIANVNGTGLKIGVLSDGVTSLASRQATGDLPATVTVLPGQTGTGDEGTAMLELIYDLAPGAQLYFATAFTSITSFAQNIRDLRTAGCDIIVDDISYFYETPFQNGQAGTVVSSTNGGVVVQAVNDVTVGSQAGALYFSSAANSGNKNDNTAGAWEGDFVDGGGTTAPIPLGNNVHNFGGGVTQNALTVAGRVILKWSDPLGASSNDYDLYILNSAGTTVNTSSTNVQTGTQDPLEDAGNRAVGERIVIVKKVGAANRFLHLNTNRGVLSVSTNGTVYGHNAGLNTISVAATPSGPVTFDGVRFGPFPGFHTTANVVEQFSSDGPRRIFYNADSSPITPGNVSSTGGQLLQKPDLTAADGSSTTTPGFTTFFGTSAAAPHAGAIAALLKQSSPASTRTQIYNALTSSALDIEAAGVDRDSGAGIIMPLRAMVALGVPGPAFLENGTPAVTEIGNGNGRLDPGESATMNIPLNNVGLANATAVSAVLTTSTSGVIITNGLAPSAVSYPNIAVPDGSGLNSAPFAFSLAGSFPCGGPINFTLTVTYAGGSTPTQMVNFTVDTAAVSTINSTLDATAPPNGTGYTATTGTQTGRLNRNGSISSCAAPKATPALQDVTAGRRYDAYTYTASTSGCMTITLATTNNNLGNNIYLAVYGNAGYVPTAITSNYLADWGVTTAGLVTVSFNATAGQQFTIVVHEIAVGGGTGANYTLTTRGPIFGACAVATAASVTIAGRVSDASGNAVRNAQIVLSGANGTNYSVKTNSFGYYTIENVSAGATYTAAVKAKGLTFSQQTVNVNESIDGLNFTAEP